VSPKHADLIFLKDLIEAGTVTPVIDRSYPLSEARQAIAHVSGARTGGGHASGKVTITIPEASMAVA
jgi:NADPH:quinone reductase-like Zn-dependent oxidoreductase